MEQKKINLIWLLISIISYGVMAASFLLAPLDSTANVYDAMDIIPGLLLWLFLILGIVAQCILAKKRKEWLSQDRKRKFQARKGRCGLLNVFQNRPAIVADISLVVSLVGIILVSAFTERRGYVCNIFIGICIFSFCLHCIFNGKIYKYVMGITNKGGNGNGKV